MSKQVTAGSGIGSSVQKSPVSSTSRGCKAANRHKYSPSKSSLQPSLVGRPVIDTKRFYEDIIETAVRPALVDPKKFREQTASMLRRAALDASCVRNGNEQGPGPAKLFITSDMEISVNGKAPEFIRIRDNPPAPAGSPTAMDDSCEPTDVAAPMSLLPSIVSRPALRYHGMPWVKRSRNYVGRKWQGLHDEIEDFVEWIQPTLEEVNMRDYVYRRLESVIKSLYPEALVDVFGSYKTDLYLPTSDIDIVVIGKWPAQQLPLHTLRDAIVRENIADEAHIKVIDRAAVPIIKVTDRATDIRVDISFNKVNGVQSAKLIGDYLDTLRPLKPLVLVLKQFLLQRDLNEVFKGGISSYGLILLVVNFLRQHPCYNFVYDNYHANYGVLLLEFFELYGLHFNWKETAIRIHPHPQYISKAEIAADMEAATGQAPSYMCIEDPLERGNDIGRSTYAAMAIMQAFQNAYSQLVVAVETSCQWKSAAVTVSAKNYRPRRHSSSSSSAGPDSTASSAAASPRSTSESSSSDGEEEENEQVGDDSDADAASSSSAVEADDTATGDDEGILCDNTGGLVLNANRQHSSYRNRHPHRHTTRIDESESYLGRIIRIQPHVLEYRKRLKQQHAMVKVELAMPTYKTEAKISTDSSSAGRMSASGRTGVTSLAGGNSTKIHDGTMLTSSFTLPFAAAAAAAGAQQFNYFNLTGKDNFGPSNRAGGRRSAGGMIQTGGDRFTASDTDADALPLLNPIKNSAPNSRRHHKTASPQQLYRSNELFATYAAESDDIAASVVGALVSPVNTNAGVNGKKSYGAALQKSVNELDGTDTSRVQQHRSTLPETSLPAQFEKPSRATHSSGRNTGKSKEKKQKFDSEAVLQSPAKEKTSFSAQGADIFVDDAERLAVSPSPSASVMTPRPAPQQHRTTLGSLPGADIVANRYDQQMPANDAGNVLSRADSAPPSQPGGNGRAEAAFGEAGNLQVVAGSAVQPPVVVRSSGSDPSMPSRPPEVRPVMTHSQTTGIYRPQQLPVTGNDSSTSGKKATVPAQLPYIPRPTVSSTTTEPFVVHSGADRSLVRQRPPQPGPSRRIADNQVFAAPTSQQQHSTAGILFQRPRETRGVAQQPRYGPPPHAAKNPIHLAFGVDKSPMLGFTSYNQQQHVPAAGGVPLQAYNMSSDVGNDYISYGGDGNGGDEVDGGGADDSRTTTTQDDDDANTADFGNDDESAAATEQEGGEEWYEEEEDERWSNGGIVFPAGNKRFGRNHGPLYADRGSAMMFSPSLLFVPPPHLAQQQQPPFHHQHHTAPSSLSSVTASATAANSQKPALNKPGDMPPPPPPSFISQLTQEQLAAAIVASAMQQHQQQRGGSAAQQQQFMQSLSPQWLAVNMAAAAAGLVGPPRFVDPILSAAAAGAGFPANSSNITAFPQHFVHHHHHHGGGGTAYSQRHHSGSAAGNRNYNRPFNNKYNSTKSFGGGGYGSDSGGSRNVAGNQRENNNNNYTSGRGGGTSDDWPIGDNYQRRTAATRNNNNRDNNNSSYYQNQQYGGDNSQQQQTSLSRPSGGAATQRGRQDSRQQQTDQSSSAVSRNRPASAHSAASASSSATTANSNSVNQQQRYYQGPPRNTNNNNNNNYDQRQQYGNRSFGGAGSKHRRDADSDTSA